MSINNPMNQNRSPASSIDLNADLGEGSPHDEAILSVVSSANISCGAHAGDEQSISQAIAFAKANNVVIGAHPSYPDRKNTGRKSLSLSPSALRYSLTEQLTYIQSLAKQSETQIRYVKAHGALYNDMAKDIALAEHFCQAVHDFDSSLAIMGLAGSVMESVCRTREKTFIAEAFIDRRYHPNGTLVARTHPGAVLEEATQAVEQALQLIQSQCVTSLSGELVHIKAGSLCLHGDTATALAIAEQLRAALHAQAIEVRATL